MCAKSSGVTPLMQQYFDIKEQYSDFIVFFQVGDFYELFFEDAKRVSSFLGITLTKRGNINGEPVPLAGVPMHALDHHLNKLVKGGFKVVICDQLEPASPGKVVKRGVRQVLTPGTLTDSKLLDDKSASYILFISKNSQNFGLIFVEILTGQIFTTVVDDEKGVETELCRFFPDEVVVLKTNKNLSTFFKSRGYVVTIFDDIYDEILVKDWISKKLEKSDFFVSFDALVQSSVLMYSYFKKNHEDVLESLSSVYTYKSEDFLLLDYSTQKNLELVSNSKDGSRKNTLFSVLDNSVTPMGSRMIKKWILRPLLKMESINFRLDVVELFVSNIVCKEKIILALKQISDIERVVGRISLNRASLQDYVNLKNALEVFPSLQEVLKEFKTYKILNSVSSRLNNFYNLFSLLDASLNDDFEKSFIIKLKFDNKLDEIRELVQNGHKKILELEQKEIDSTKISSLKIRYNDVVGYYIEVTKTNMHLVPDHYKRIQTLANRERYITSDLKELELKIDKAKKEVDAIEQELYSRIKSEVYNNVSKLKQASYVLSHLDALVGLAETAYSNNYVRPIFNQNTIEIRDGRHPVVEQTLDSFVPNNSLLNEDQHLWILTGPNMGGKSTFLRQVALISLMGQIGSFVPAKYANLKLLDRIFTRIGAGDNLAEGKSTFLVEMEETATICKSATRNSLVILDEVGRGTSTYDGFAIAQAVVEYIHKHIHSFCLFATHYHELTALDQILQGVVSYHAVSRKTENGILFLHKIEKGIAEGSFGLEVARIAELPDEILNRASHILSTINNKFNKKTES